MPSGHELGTSAEGQLHPIPADFQLALASKPRGIDPTAFALGDDLRALCDQLEGRDRQDQAEALQRRRRAEERRL
jgi:hypothetical protein